MFDITKTNVTSRRAPVGTSLDWQNQRNTQCNFDTVIQLVSLRAQPEEISNPVKLNTNTDPFDKFGLDFAFPLDYWTFTFTINHAGVFDDEENKFGLLLADCDNVPMIKMPTIPVNLSNCLDISNNLRNIYFEGSDEDE